MPEAIGGIVGGIFGDSGGGSQQTASKAPWEPADPWLRQQIQDGQDLERYYQSNPFNSLQQTGYQNLFSDIDNFRSNIAPGLMNFANGMMNSRYQRAPAGTELGASNPYNPQGQMQGQTGAYAMGPAAGQTQGGMADTLAGLSGRMPGGGIDGMQQRASGGWGGAMGQMPSSGESAPAGLLSSAMGGMSMQGRQGGMSGIQGAQPNGAGMPAGGSMDNQGGLLSQAVGGVQTKPAVFSSPAGQSYGLLDFNGPNGLNPWAGILAQREADKAKTPESTMTMDEQIEDYLRRRDPQAWQEWDQNRRLGQGGA